jgi:hypothetical protein
MSRATTAVLVFVAVAGVATILRFTLFGERASDSQLIREALQESIEAGKEGRPGSVLELLSRQFEVNGYQPNARQISQYVKDLKPDVEIANPEPNIRGDEASIVSDVNLKLRFPPQSFRIEDVTFQFQREQATQWLIFPASRWRLRSVEVPPDALNQLSGLNPGTGFPGL